MTRSNPMQEYIEMHIRRKALRDELDALEARMKTTAEEVINHFIELGGTRLGTDKGTIYLRSETRVSLVDDEMGTKDTAHAKLRAHGLGNMVKDHVSVQTLASWVREQRREGREIPPGLAPHIKISERTTVQVLTK